MSHNRVQQSSDTVRTSAADTNANGNQDYRKNGQNLQEGQMRFFMASAVKKWRNFSKLAMKWPIWQPCCRQCERWRFNQRTT